MTSPHSDPRRSPFGARLDSFRWAFRGLGVLLRTQQNAWIHAVATGVVVFAGLAFRVTRLEWALLLFACAIVWIAEALNTAVEFLADAAIPEFHAGVGRAKDVAAAAVLLAALGAAGVGAFVFAPRALALFAR